MEAKAFAASRAPRTLEDLPLLADLLEEDMRHDDDEGGGGGGACGVGAGVGGGGGGQGGGAGAIPGLDLSKAGHGGAASSSVAPDPKGAGWRRLQRPKAAGLLGRATSTHVQGPLDGAYNTFPEMRVCGLVR